MTERADGAAPSVEHRLEGLEPDNLLAFLALLGLLRVLEHSRPEWRVRARWDLDLPPLRPLLVLAVPQDRGALADAAAEGCDHLAATYDDVPVAGEEPPKDLTFDGAQARRLLNGAADASEGLPWAVLCSDAATRQDGRVEATPLCFIFGQGHQHFLERLASVPRLRVPPKRGRGKNSVELTAAQVLADALFAPWERGDPTPSFRWDPAEDVRYALQAADPSGRPGLTQHGANRLAALALAVLPVAPQSTARRVRLGMPGARTEGGQTHFGWPIWRKPASLEGICALLAHPGLWRPGGLAHLGVAEVRTARRLHVGKYMNVARAELLQVGVDRDAE